MSWRKNPATNLPLWSVEIQYYVNDVVISPSDSGPYLMSGAGLSLATSETSVRGGLDPVLDVTGNWVALSAKGLGYNNWDQRGVTFTAGAGTAITCVLNPLLPLALDANSVWLLMLSGTTTVSAPSAPLTAANTLSWTWTSIAATTSTITVDVPPLVGATVQNWSASCVINMPSTVLPATTANLVLTGSAGVALAATNVLTAGTWTLLRVA